MALNHGPSRDTDPHFIIDPVTRKMSTDSNKIILVQGDHNSERLTFEVPQEVEGHKMELSHKIQIHYINIDQMSREQSKGVSDAEEIQIVPADGEKPARVSFSWLIPHTATRYQGLLNFVVRFTCEEGTTTLYSWSTAIHSGISVTDGINNGEAIVEEYNDILMAWKQELKANQIVSLEQTKTGSGDDAENVWTATFGDGRTEELKVKNGSRGPTGLIGSIETIQGHPLHFFVGTKDEYNALPEAQKENLFAIITDDTAPDALVAALEALEKISSGETVVPQAAHAIAADRATWTPEATNAGYADVAAKIVTSAPTLTTSTGVVNHTLAANTLYAIYMESSGYTFTLFVGGDAAKHYASSCAKPSNHEFYIQYYNGQITIECKRQDETIFTPDNSRTHTLRILPLAEIRT